MDTVEQWWRAHLPDALDAAAEAAEAQGCEVSLYDLFTLNPKAQTLIFGSICLIGIVLVYKFLWELRGSGLL